MTIENLGRTPVTVSATLDFGRYHWRRFGRRTVMPRTLAFDGISTNSRRTRLEPFDEVSFLFDVWTVLDPQNGEPPKLPIAVRAAARVAGKRLMRRSPARKQWTIAPGQKRCTRDW